MPHPAAGAAFDQTDKDDRPKKIELFFHGQRPEVRRGVRAVQKILGEREVPDPGHPVL